MDQQVPRKKFGPLEIMLAVFGLFSLGSGILRGEELQLFWGIIILGGLGLLIVVRRKDWPKHWQEMEERSRRHREASQRNQSPPQKD